MLLDEKEQREIWPSEESGNDVTMHFLVYLFCETVRRRLVVVKRETGESTSLFLTLRHITIFED